MTLFECETAGQYLRARLQYLPNGGRGELSRLSEKVRIHTTSLSQIVSGARALSMEQAALICRDLDMNELETRFFLTLVQMDRCGSDALKEILQAQLTEMRRNAEDLVHVVRKDKTLTEDEKAQFYSHWYYTGLAVLTSIPGLCTIEALASYTSLSRSRIKQALDFLLRSGIIKGPEGAFEPGAKSTHLDSQSPLISRHHANWRFRAIEKHPSLEAHELAYSSPMSLSKKDAKKIRALLVQAVKDVGAIRDPSPCEEAYCLNIDWFKF